MCATDVASAIKGKQEGFVALPQKRTNKSRYIDVFSFCFHQQNLMAKSALLSNTLKGVISIMNYIRANAKQHQRFRQLLQFDDEAFSVDLPYLSKVR